MLEIGDRWEGSVNDGASVAVSVTSAQYLTQIAGWGGFEIHSGEMLAALGLPFPDAYDRAATAPGLRAWRIAPDRVLVQSKEPKHFGSTPDLAILDLSHAKIAVRIAGPGGAALLSRTAAIDLSEKAFPAGSFVQTAIHGIGVLIDRPERDVFEVFMPGSWAQSLVEFLTGHLADNAVAH